MTRASRASTATLLATILIFHSASAQTQMQSLSPNPGDDASTTATELSKPLRLMPKQSRPLATERVPTANLNKPAILPSHHVVKVEGLTEIDPNSIGSLTSKNGGFGTDMWQGTPRLLIERLLPRLPDAIHSPTLRKLTRRLLLSAATLPASTNGGTATSGLSLIATRLRKLQAMGAFKDARELAALAPKRMQDPALLKVQADDRLFANDYGNACMLVDAASDHLTTPYWQQLLVFCQTLRGDRESAALGAGLLAETLGTTDPTYFKLIDRLTIDAKEPILSLPHPSALHLAVMRTAHVTIPDDAVLTPHPSILRAIGISPNARLKTRLEAAEKATDAGALTSELLAKIYMAEKFDPVELNNALSLAAADRSPRGRALLFQAAQVEFIGVAQAAVYSKAFELAQEDGRYLAVIDLYRPLLAELGASEELNWFADKAARAFYSLDRPLPARRWMEFLRLAAEQNNESKTTLDALWLLGFLTESDDSQLDTGLLNWLDAHRQKSKNRFRQVGSAGLHLIEALGYDVPNSAWWTVLESAGGFSTATGQNATRHAMLRAAAAGRRGETVLLMLLTFDGKAPRIEDIETTKAAARALRLIELEKEARQLVLELAAAEGL